MGLSYNDMGRSNIALTYHEKAVKISEAINHPELGKMYNNIGLCYLSLFRIMDALFYFEKCKVI